MIVCITRHSDIFFSIKRVFVCLSSIVLQFGAFCCLFTGNSIAAQVLMILKLKFSATYQIIIPCLICIQPEVDLTIFLSFNSKQFFHEKNQHCSQPFSFTHILIFICNRLGLMVVGGIILASFMTYASEHLAIRSFVKGLEECDIARNMYPLSIL